MPYITSALTLASLAGDKNTWAPGASLKIVAHVFLPVMRVLAACRTKRDFMSKFEIAITTLFIGFVLGQATDVAKYYLIVWRKKKAFKAEVSDHLNHMHYLKDRLCTIAKDFSDPKIIGLPIPGKIKTYIFSKYYAEILPHLSSSMRQHYVEHYGTIDSFNNCLLEIPKTQPELIGKKLFNLYYYTCLLTETARYVLSEEKTSVKDNDRLMSSINTSASKFAQEYSLLQAQQGS